MHGNLQRQIEDGRKIEGQLSTGADKIVPRPNWIAFARQCWPPPKKIDVELAIIAGCDPRTARRWLSGEFDPPRAVWKELNKRLYE